jgi:hypothetical protein
VTDRGWLIVIAVSIVVIGVAVGLWLRNFRDCSDECVSHTTLERSTCRWMCR